MLDLSKFDSRQIIQSRDRGTVTAVKEGTVKHISPNNYDENAITRFAKVSIRCFGKNIESDGGFYNVDREELSRMTLPHIIRLKTIYDSLLRESS